MVTAGHKCEGADSRFLNMLSAPHLREVVQRAILAEAGEASPGWNQLARAFDVLWDQLSRQLEPVLGKAATSAVFARALYLAALEFPSVTDLVTKHADRCSGASAALEVGSSSDDAK